MEDETKKDSQMWGVVHVGPLMFLGAFCDYPLVSEGAEMPVGDAGRELLQEAIDRVERAMMNGRVIRLAPVMELAAPLQQVRQSTPMGERVGVAKSPLPMPYGFTTGKATLHVLPNAVAFIDEMTEGDQKIYRAFIESVTKAEQEERASRAGITLASSLNGGARG